FHVTGVQTCALPISFLKKQIVGVFNLELARLYSYLYQQTDSNYYILHSLDGYDEVSLTGPFKMIGRQTEEDILPTDLGFDYLERSEERLVGKQIEER